MVKYLKCFNYIRFVSFSFAHNQFHTDVGGSFFCSVALAFQRLIQTSRMKLELMISQLSGIISLFPLSGNPKGAMLTHENVVADAAGVIKGFEVRRK